MNPARFTPILNGILEVLRSHPAEAARMCSLLEEVGLALDPENCSLHLSTSSERGGPHDSEPSGPPPSHYALEKTKPEVPC